MCVGPRSVLVNCNAVRVPGFRCEVKDQRTLPGKRALAAFAQAEKTCANGEIPVAIFHVARDDDYAMLRLGHLLELASCGMAGDHGAGGATDHEPTAAGGECEG